MQQGPVPLISFQIPIYFYVFIIFPSTSLLLSHFQFLFTISHLLHISQYLSILSTYFYNFTSLSSFQIFPFLYPFFFLSTPFHFLYTFFFLSTPFHFSTLFSFSLSPFHFSIPIVPPPKKKKKKTFSINIFQNCELI